MNIDKFKHQHRDTLDGIDRLRASSQEGVAEHAEQIAAQIVAMRGVVRLHLAVENETLYPAPARGGLRLARMSQVYQSEMGEAKRVLRTLYQRIRREGREFYPAIEPGMPLVA